MCIVTCTCIQYMNLIFFISAAFTVYIQVCGCICIFHMHWKQSGRGVGNMTASLACSGGDLAHHLPSVWQQKIDFSFSPLQAVGCGLAFAQKNPCLKYVGDQALLANVKAANAKISPINDLETIKWICHALFPESVFCFHLCLSLFQVCFTPPSSSCVYVCETCYLVS